MPIRVVPSAGTPPAKSNEFVMLGLPEVGGLPPRDHDGLSAMNEDMYEAFRMYAEERGIKPVVLTKV